MDAQLGFDDVVRLLTVLRPLFLCTPEQVAESAAFGNARDNAAGAVARIILKDCDVVPLDQVLPVLLEALPLKNDFIENRVVFRCIFHLFQVSASNPKVMPVLLAHIDRLIAVFVYVLKDGREEEIGAETREQLIALVRHLTTVGDVGGKIQAAGLGRFL
jgi:hypothetical protein